MSPATQNGALELFCTDGGSLVLQSLYLHPDEIAHGPKKSRPARSGDSTINSRQQQQRVVAKRKFCTRLNFRYATAYKCACGCINAACNAHEAAAAAPARRIRPQTCTPKCSHKCFILLLGKRPESSSLSSPLYTTLYYVDRSPSLSFTKPHTTEHVDDDTIPCYRPFHRSRFASFLAFLFLCVCVYVAGLVCYGFLLVNALYALFYC